MKNNEEEMTAAVGSSASAKEPTKDDDNEEDLEKVPGAALDETAKGERMVAGVPSDNNKKRKATDTFKPRRKKPRDAPRRPLSAYNIYFREERAALIARNDQGKPDEDFRVNLDSVVATGKKRDDPSAVFQAAARTLATRWKNMDSKDKAPYKESAEEEMKKYRARVYEYESRMVEEARQKSSSGSGNVPERIGVQSIALDSSIGSDQSKEMGRSSQGSSERTHLSSDLHIGATQLPSRLSGVNPLAGLAPGQGVAVPGSLNYNLLQPGLRLSEFQANNLLLPTHRYTDLPPLQPHDDTLIRILRAQSQMGGIPSLQGDVLSNATRNFGDWAAQRSIQGNVLAALQRESLLRERFNAAQAAHVPVAATIAPPGSIEEQLLLQMLERQRQERYEEAKSNTYPRHHPSFPPR